MQNIGIDFFAADFRTGSDYLATGSDDFWGRLSSFGDKNS